MLKKSIGYGLLICVVFFASLVLIPVKISPSASMIVGANQFSVQQVLSDINRFRDWDPRVISDSTVLYNSVQVDGKLGLEVTDTFNVVIANYRIDHSTIDEVDITVELKNTNTFQYRFLLEPAAQGTKVTWNLDLDVNLMLFLFSAESRLEDTFSGGLAALNELLK
jgi:hypothetical protein